MNDMTAPTLSNICWHDTKTLTDKVHLHICGHANYTDFRTLPERNHILNENVKVYTTRLLSECSACRATAPPQPSQKLSISSLSQHCNQTLCVDNLFFNGLNLVHFMDEATHYSTAHIVETTNTFNALYDLELTFLSTFWAPDFIIDDKAFQRSEFINYLQDYGIKFLLTPTSRHGRNKIESKRNVLPSILLLLKDSDTCPYEANASLVTI